MRWLLPDGASRLLWFGLIPHRGEEQRQWEIRNVIRISCSVQRQVLREDAIQKGCVTLVEKRGQNTTPGDVTKSKEPNMHVMGWTPRAMTQMQSPWQHRRGGPGGRNVKPSFCHQLSYSQQGFLLPRFRENIKHMSSLLKTKESPWFSLACLCTTQLPLKNGELPASAPLCTPKPIPAVCFSLRTWLLSSLFPLSFQP